MQRFEIPLRLPGANEYITKSYSNRHKGNNFKKATERDIVMCIKARKLRYIKRPVFVKFVWFEATKKRDKDNVAFRKKFILDAMQKARILPNDDNNYIYGFADYFVYGEGQKVVVEIYDCDEVEINEDDGI